MHALASEKLKRISKGQNTSERVVANRGADRHQFMSILNNVCVSVCMYSRIDN